MYRSDFNQHITIIMCIVHTFYINTNLTIFAFFYILIFSAWTLLIKEAMKLSTEL